MVQQAAADMDGIGRSPRSRRKMVSDMGILQMGGQGVKHLAHGDLRRYDQEGLCASDDGLWQGGVGRLLGQVLFDRRRTSQKDGGAG